MKRFAGLALLGTLLAFTLLGQQQSAKAPDPSPARPTSTQVMKFMEAMQTRSRLESSVQAQREDIAINVHNMFHKALPNATPEEKTKMENIIAGALSEMFSNYPFDDVLRDMIPIYQNHFSESELNQIVAFYSSSVGQKVLKEMPAMSAQLIRVSNMRLQPQIDEMMKNLTQRLQEMVDAEAEKSK